jgi:hypothetical protein
LAVLPFSCPHSVLLRPCLPASCLLQASRPQPVCSSEWQACSLVDTDHVFRFPVLCYGSRAAPAAGDLASHDRPWNVQPGGMFALSNGGATLLKATLDTNWAIVSENLVVRARISLLTRTCRRFLERTSVWSVLAQRVFVSLRSVVRLGCPAVTLSCGWAVLRSLVWVRRSFAFDRMCCYGFLLLR